jgi:sugar lactone lactonase YvrE
MTDSSAPRVAVHAHPEVGESPSWDAQAGVLRFVDVHPGVVYRYDPADGSLTSCAVGQEVGAVIVREAGGIVVAARDGIGAVDEATGRLELIAPIELDRPGSRLNDAKCDPAGRLWAGSMAFDFAPGAGSLYRVLPDHSVTRVVGEVTISNGLGWSPDGDRMYYIDTMAGGVDVFDFDLATGEVTDRRRLVSFEESDGIPDGLAVDAEGHVWVALFGGGCVRRYAPDGRLDDRLELPVSQPTCVAFGGDDLGDLYVTTAAYQLTAEQLAEQPLAGATFVCRPGVAGTPVHPFAG